MLPRTTVLCFFLISLISGMAQPPLNYLTSTDGGSAYEVCYHDNHLYAGCANTLMIYDLQGPSHRPGGLLYKHRFRSNIDHISVQHGALYICANHTGLFKYDISDPAMPSLLAHYAPAHIDASIYEAGLYGDSVIVAAKNELNLLVESGGSFQFVKTIASYPGSSRIRGLDIKGDMLAYTLAYSPANASDGIYLLDLPNLTQLDFYHDNIGDPLEVNFGQQTDLLHVMGGAIASTLFDGRYYALDISTPSSMQLAFSDTIKGNVLVGGTIAAPMSAVNINDTLYIATQGGGPASYMFPDPYEGQVYVYDATDKQNIHFITDLYAGLYHFDIDINTATQTMYVASEWYGILTVDIGDMFNEIDRGKTWTGGWCSGSAYAKNRLVEASEGYGIRLFDVSSISQPQLIAEDTTVGFCRAISISDSADYIYCWYLTGSRLRVRDANSLAFVADTSVDPGVLFIGDFKKSRYHDGKIAVIEEVNQFSKKITLADVSNPTQPQVRFTRRKNNIEDIVFYPSGLLFACARDSLIVFDNNMQIVAATRPPLGALQQYKAFSLSQDTLYVYYQGVGEGIAKYHFDATQPSLSYIETASFKLDSRGRIFMATNDTLLYIASSIDSLKAVKKEGPYDILDRYDHGADFIFNNLWGVQDMYFKGGFLFLNEYMGQSSIFGQAKTMTAIEPAFSSHKPPLLYPNPAKEAVWIRTAGAEQLHIFDLSGKIILERKINQDELEIDTRTLSKGLYFVAVRSKTGIRSEKLLIE